MGRKATTIEVIAPTFRRPERALAMAQSWQETKVLRSTDLCLALDDDDEWLAHYISMSAGKPWFALPSMHGSMVKRTNLVARSSLADIIGWAADDNIFRTRGWDHMVKQAFEDPAITTVNTNDLLVGDTKGGVYFVRKTVVDALGWLLPPFLEHLYADFAVTELAKAAGTYLYLPDVIIEHMHPHAGKADWDAQYHSYNNVEQDSRDGQAFAAWRTSERFVNDMEVLRKCSTQS